MSTRGILAVSEAYVQLLTGDTETPMHVRMIDDARQKQGARKLYGPIRDLWSQIEEYQAQKFGAFAVVNAGGDTDDAITAVRANFIDTDGTTEQGRWHLPPSFIVRRDATHWHAYWLVDGEPIERFKEVQKRLSAYYGSDPAVCNLSRVMRLPGTLHFKTGAPILVTLQNDDEPWALSP